ncbi:putative glucuronosyltransferase [Medicago truncatula]|uniref:Acetylglucosaminyltransferase, putative n=1 Tax=Medicago truncatula TaxID=3880 RepID=A0A072TKW3_MEDTR|nr:acetylglucosaminyltransferase, putative [Medicago truncatula]RHN74158.1 putative glucuronosyltransferase [Medicago truncatula]
MNHDHHFMEQPSKRTPSNAPFARKFVRNVPVFNKIDAELLGRNADGCMPNMWFSQANSSVTKQHSAVRNITELRLGPGAERLKHRIDGYYRHKIFTQMSVLNTHV